MCSNHIMKLMDTTSISAICMIVLQRYLWSSLFVCIASALCKAWRSRQTERISEYSGRPCGFLHDTKYDNKRWQTIPGCLLCSAAFKTFRTSMIPTMHSVLNVLLGYHIHPHLWHAQAAMCKFQTPKLAKQCAWYTHGVPYL